LKRPVIRPHVGIGDGKIIYICPWLDWRTDGLRQLEGEGAKRVQLFQLISSPPIINQAPQLICRIFGLNLANHHQVIGAERRLWQASRGSFAPARTSEDEYRTVNSGKTRITKGNRLLQRARSIR